MRTFSFIHTLFFTFLSLLTCLTQAQGLAPEKILNRSERSLPPPPANLRATSENPSVRYVQRDVEEGFEKKGDLQKFEVKAADSIGELPEELHESREAEPFSLNSQNRSLTTGFSGKRLFGVGLVGGGAYGIFGGEISLGFGNEWAMGAGIGTGLTYSTWALHARYYFVEGRLNPFMEFGYANWTLNRVSKTGQTPRPEYIAGRFFKSKNNYKVGTTCNLLYPALGILFQDSSGIAVSLQLQYFINIKNTNGALYGSTGMHYYF